MGERFTGQAGRRELRRSVGADARMSSRPGGSEIGHPISPVGAIDIVDLLRATPEFTESQIDSCSLLWTRKKLRKRLWEFDMSYRQRAGASRRGLSVIAKQYASERGAYAFRAMRWLEGQGFRPPSRLRIARPLAYDPARLLLLQEKAKGAELASALRGELSALAMQCQAAAGWLVKLHESDGDGFNRPAVSAVRSIRRRRREVAIAYPAYKARLYDVGGRLMQEIRASRHGAAAPTHGDYHLKNVFIDGRHVTVIDLDHFALREPATDVGYFVGQLAIVGYLRHGSFAVVLSAMSAFLDAYGDGVAGPPPWRRVAAHVSRTFIQSLHYELCVLRNERTDLLDPWLDQAEAWLESTQPSDVPQLLASPRRYLSGLVRTTGTS